MPLSQRTVKTLLLGAGFALAGCGDAQPPGAMPRALTPNATAQSYRGSWMAPGTSGEDLLYVSNQASGDVWVYSYPQGKLVGELSPTEYAVSGLCSDSKGDVFFTTFGDDLTTYLTSVVYEYAHGGTKPVATLTDPGFGNDCAIDTTTGNLAVVNWFGSLDGYDHGNVAIYENAQGNATVYYDSNIYWYEWCAYDTDGNLYVDGYNEGGGYPLAELPEGSGSFTNITVDGNFSPESLQWYSGDLLISAGQLERHPTTETIYRVQISGSGGTIVGSTALRTNGKARRAFDGLDRQNILVGKTLIGAGFDNRDVDAWRFPKGGIPRKLLGPIEGGGYGVTLSIPPTDARSRS